MTLRLPGLLPALALIAPLGLAAPSLAQTAPLTLPPPGAAASAKAPARAKKPVSRKKAEDSETGLALPGGTRAAKRTEPTFSESAVARPKRYVPAEFDNDDAGGSPRPIMTPSGRAGVGMRF